MRAPSRLFALIAASSLWASVSSPVLAADAVDLPALLKTIAARQDQIDAFQKNVSYTETTRLESLDKQGKVETSGVVVMDVTVKDGKTHKTLVSASKDGHDETAKAREEAAKHDQDEGDDDDEALPLAAKEQPKHTFTLLGPVAEAPGKLRLKFERTSDHVTGNAIVDPATGDVISISFIPAKLPKFVDRLNIVMQSGAKSSAGMLPSVIDTTVEASILFVKKRMRTHTEMTNYKAAGR